MPVLNTTSPAMERWAPNETPSMTSPSCSTSLPRVGTEVRCDVVGGPIDRRMLLLLSAFLICEEVLITA